jgi:hypothetical protein
VAEMELTKKDMRPGTVLKNGAVLLLHKGDDDEDSPVFPVLCVYEGNFVTWNYDERDGHCRSGGYHMGNLEAALKEFADL